MVQEGAPPLRAVDPSGWGSLTGSVRAVGQAAFASQPSRLVAKVKAAALERLAKGKEQSRTSLRALIAGLKEHGEEA